MATATTTTKPTDIKPPFDEEKAKLKVKAAENTWNTCSPELVAKAYTEDSKWRNRTQSSFTVDKQLSIFSKGNGLRNLITIL
ncbi:MAG: DUF1348 family protein [Nitrososphaeraceae archaeon]|nr:DUF1348 family protein [Nitrososphaeraceae archaeon]